MKSIIDLKSLIIGALSAVVIFISIGAAPASQKVKHYKVLKAANFSEFEFNTKKLLKEGWQPQGGVAVAFDKFGTSKYSQAFVK